MPTLTNPQFIRGVNELKKHAKEDLSVRFFSSAYWAYGSEVAILRLADAYRNAPEGKVSHGYSENLGTYYFKLEAPCFEGDMSTDDIAQ